MIEHDGLLSREVAVLRVLLNHAGLDTMACSLLWRTIVQESRLSRMTVYRALHGDDKGNKGLCGLGRVTIRQQTTACGDLGASMYKMDLSVPGDTR